MMDTIRAFFAICYIIAVFCCEFLIRLLNMCQQPRAEPLEERSTTLDCILRNIPIIGMIILPLFYTLTQFLANADYSLQILAGFIGVIISAFAVWLFWRSHHDLGQQWSATLEIQPNHLLVTEGIYSQIRHPMYSASILLGIAQPFLLQNWIAGFSLLITFLPFYFYRVPKEEAMMLKQFGEEYQQYMNRTGRLFPLIFR